MDNLCASRKGTKVCQSKSNASGIKYTKITGEVSNMGGSSIQTAYYIFNPTSEYKGIIISTEGLSMENINGLENKLDNLVDSLVFLKK